MNGGQGALRISRKDYPALSNFLRGYLHEDYRQEHGSAARAVEAFCRAATPAEQAAVASDLDAFLAATLALRHRERIAGLQALGGAWRPRSSKDLERLRALIPSPPAERD